MSAIDRQTARPNWFFEGTHGNPGSNIGYKKSIFFYFKQKFCKIPQLVANIFFNEELKYLLDYLV